MDSEARIWALVGVLVALVTMGVPVLVTLGIFKSGGKPEKDVEIDTIGPFDPLNDLSGLADETTLRLVIGDSSYDNIVIWRFSLRNRGGAPITPNDFFKPLRVSVDPPWEIISIKDSYDFEDVTLDWDRLASTTLVAEPFLLNPGDSVSQTVYITAREATSDKGKLDITARIENLKRFAPAVSLFDQPRKYAMVYLSFSDAISLVLVASLFFYWYAVLLYKSGLAKLPSRSAFFLLVVAAALSYSAAEVITYYAFGGEPISERIFGRRLLQWKYQIHNWAILALHIVLSSYLYLRSRA